MADSDEEQPKVTMDNGWIELKAFLRIVHRNIADAQSELAKLKTAQGHLVLKDLRISVPAELSVTRDSRARIRFPSEARALDPDFRDAHLSQLSFALTYIPVTSD